MVVEMVSARGIEWVFLIAELRTPGVWNEKPHPAKRWRDGPPDLDMSAAGWATRPLVWTLNKSPALAKRWLERGTLSKGFSRNQALAGPPAD
jgi:hypothetical protein